MFFRLFKSRRFSRCALRCAVLSVVFLTICTARPTRADTEPTTQPVSQPVSQKDPFFTLVAMPDTQYYTEVEWKAEKYFQGQTHWIVSNWAKEHIAFVFQLGDLQQDGNLLRLDKQPDPTVKELLKNPNPEHPPENDLQWQRASDAMQILDDANVPYSAVAGNHDYFHWDRKMLPVKFLKYFGPQRYAGKSWFGGSSPAMGTSPAGMDMYQYFQAGGHRFLSIGLQFAPQQWDLDWAQKIIDANPGLPTIVTTHAYISNKGPDKDRRNIWEKLVRKNPQIFMTINGHINGHNEVTEKDDAGQDVFEILVDYQDLKVPGYERGGGYMRLMRFYTDKNQIEVKTYSPVTEKFLDNPKDQFTLDCNFAQRFALQPEAAIKP